MKNQKREHICIAVFKDGHCFGASEPMWKSEAFDAMDEAFKNDVACMVIDLNNLFQGKAAIYPYNLEEGD